MHSRRAAARRPSSHDGLCQLSRLLIDDVSAILPRATGGLQDAERYHGSAHVLPTPRCRGNMLAHAGPAAQEVSELVVAAAIPPRRSSALQSQHRSTSALDAAVILLKSVVQIATCPMPHMAAELGPECPGIGIVAVRGNPIWGYAGHRLCRSKEGLGGGKVAVLTQHHVDQGASAIDRAIQIPPTTTHPNVCLVDVPASADFAFRRRRRFSANAGVSLASQSRTAS